jgi:RNA polymerase sigma-70 factor, ECF subfamily
MERMTPTATATATLPAQSADAFGEAADPFRRELLVHCYRMLGSIDDAEDAVQETFVRAWRSRATFTEAVSFRAWLYRIATNVCLDAIERRKRTPGGAAGRVVEAEPIPEGLLDATTPGPEALYDAREAISLAFLTALQVLSPRQRGVLILRDVLGWRAAEAAALLGVSVPAANSALHRARGALAETYLRPGAASAATSARAPGRVRSLLDRYVRAWEAADIAGLVSLLREDAVVTMPPGLAIVGRAAIFEFLATSVFDLGRQIRLERVGSNGDAAYLLSSRRPIDGRTDLAFEPYAVLVVDLDTDATAVSRMTVFVDPKVIARFTT